jgi:hypothetical protein
MNEAVKRLVNSKTVETFWYVVDANLAFEDESGEKGPPDDAVMRGHVAQCLTPVFEGVEDGQQHRQDQAGQQSITCGNLRAGRRYSPHIG